jgi:hypothetical protein
VLRDGGARDREARRDVTRRHLVGGYQLQDRPPLGLRDRAQDVVRDRPSLESGPQPDRLTVRIREHRERPEVAG